MAKIFVFIFVVAFSLTLAYHKLVRPASPVASLPHLMSISSPDFYHTAVIPDRFGCLDDNVNPSLVINGVPPQTESLSLIVDDPDAFGSTWTSWLVWNISPATTRINVDSTPTGAITGKNDFGNNKYNGPCHRIGIHRYYFRLYALDTRLDLPSDTRASALKSAINGHLLDQVEMYGKYER